MKTPAHCEKGSVLIISLIMLIVLTLIGITAMSTASLQEKMAGNSRDMALAFQAAEAALRGGENYYVDSVVSIGSAFDGSHTGLYPYGANPDVFSPATWANSLPYSGTIAGVAEQPRFIIEYVGRIEQGGGDLNVGGYGESSGLGTKVAVRVTARGVGGTPDAVVYLQSNFVSRN
jgi:type IV pilus assembly protein PilX